VWDEQVGGIATDVLTRVVDVVDEVDVRNLYNLARKPLLGGEV